MRKEFSAGAVIFRKEGENIKYLVLHYELGHWDFVKGNVEKGEEEKDTVKREAKEEAGIEDIVFIEEFREKIGYVYKFKGELTAKQVVYYLAETKTKEVKLSYEHIGYVLVGYHEALRTLTYDNAKEVLKKANEFLSKNKKSI